MGGARYRSIVCSFASKSTEISALARRYVDFKARCRHLKVALGEPPTRCDEVLLDLAGGNADMGAITRVLIVDDDEGIRETIRLALEDTGYTIAEASDGLAALKQLRAGRERMVVLLDLMMPGLDGAGLLGAVAADAQLSSQYAFVLITANTKTLTLAFATLLQNLSVPVLTKPFDIDTLLDAVATAAHRLVR